MSYVFISHAHRDSEIASRVREWLTQAGIATWFYTDLKPGDQWEKEIQEALQNASSVLVLLSTAAINSPSVVQEYRYILSQNKRLLIALIEPISVRDFPHSLQAVPYIDLTQDFDGGMTTIVRAIKTGADLPLSVSVEQAESPRSRTTVQLKVDLKDFDEARLVSLVTKLVEAGVQDIQVIDVAEG